MTKLAMYGHSLGGATAAAAMLRDKRILGGMDLDGRIFGPVTQQGLDRPFVIVGGPGHETATNSSWSELYSHLRGAKAELAIAKTQHNSFTDFPLLVTELHIPDNKRAAVDALLGSQNGRRLHRTLVGTLTAFLDLVFRGKSDGLRNLGSEFCDVSVVKSQLADGQ